MITATDTNPVWAPEAGEHLLWSGALFYRGGLAVKDIFMIPFSLVWSGFAFFWEYKVIMSYIRTGEMLYILFIAFGSIFVIAGIYLLVGRFFYEAYAARSTFYAVTDRRVVIRMEAFPRRVQSIFINKLDKIEFVSGKGTAGSIIFGRGSYSTYFNNATFYNQTTGMYQPVGGNLTYYNRPPGFYNIENAANVHQLILKQMKKEE